MQKINLNNLPEGYTLGVNDKGLTVLTFPGGKAIISKAGRYTLSNYGGVKAGLAFPYYQKSASEQRLGCAFDVEDNEVWLADPEEVVFSNDPRYNEMMIEAGRVFDGQFFS
jgi:hypothetical protein